ncbi:MAG: Ig-like domain-containing protein [Lysobacteraceae bacterium]
MPSSSFSCPQRTALAFAVGVALLGAGLPNKLRAATIDVNGTTCTIGEAVKSANTDSAIGGCTAGSGTDTLRLATTMDVDGNTLIIDSDLTLTSLGAPVTLQGLGVSRILQIGDWNGASISAPTVTITNINLSGGNATGGNGSDGGGGGAGLGGAVLILDGDVTIEDVQFSSNTAQGGHGASRGPSESGAGGGGGMAASGGKGGNDTEGGVGVDAGLGAGGGGGGDLFNSTAQNGGSGGSSSAGSGGGGGSTGMPPTTGGFGAGGGGGGGASGGINPSSAQAGASGGFGGGGGGGGGGTSGSSSANSGADGGFGGGGGGGGNGNGSAGNGGRGGFAAGGGAGGNGSSVNGSAGSAGDFGGNGSTSTGGGGAGMGAAIFIRAGGLTINNSTFSSNSAQGGSGGSVGQGKGAAVAVIDDRTNANNNNQGMPGSADVPVVTGCGNSFSTNTAGNQGGSDNDNHDTKGVSRSALQAACSVDTGKAIANNDNVSVNEDSGLNSLNVLSNDTPDPDDSSLFVIGAGSAGHGTTGFTTANVRYTPASNYCGPDSFIYTVNGGDTATVNINVICVDDGPAIANNDSVSVDENSGLNTINVLANDIPDPDGGSLMVTGVGAATHGATSFTTSNVRYTPTADYCGPDSFSYTIAGGGSATVSVNVRCVIDEADRVFANGFE